MNRDVPLSRGETIDKRGSNFPPKTWILSKLNPRSGQVTPAFFSQTGSLKGPHEPGASCYQMNTIVNKSPYRIGIDIEGSMIPDCPKHFGLAQRRLFRQQAVPSWLPQNPVWLITGRGDTGPMVQDTAQWAFQHLPNLCLQIFHRPPSSKTKNSIREHKWSMVQALALDGFVDSELATLEYMKRRGFRGALLHMVNGKITPQRPYDLQLQLPPGFNVNLI